MGLVGHIVVVVVVFVGLWRRYGKRGCHKIVMHRTRVRVPRRCPGVERMRRGRYIYAIIRGGGGDFPRRVFRPPVRDTCPGQMCFFDVGRGAHVAWLVTRVRLVCATTPCVCDA